jgi:hypothetical protein
MIVFEVGFPVVVYNCSFETGKNADVIHPNNSRITLSFPIGTCDTHGHILSQWLPGVSLFSAEWYHHGIIED